MKTKKNYPYSPTRQTRLALYCTSTLYTTVSGAVGFTQDCSRLSERGGCQHTKNGDLFLYPPRKEIIWPRAFRKNRVLKTPKNDFLFLYPPRKEIIWPRAFRKIECSTLGTFLPLSKKRAPKNGRTQLCRPDAPLGNSVRHGFRSDM